MTMPASELSPIASASMIAWISCCIDAELVAFVVLALEAAAVLLLAEEAALSAVALKDSMSSNDEDRSPLPRSAPS